MLWLALLLACGSPEEDTDPVSTGTGTDSDQDGVPDHRDCADDDPSIYPGAEDLCGNGIDEDCSGSDALCEVSCGDTDSPTITQGVWGQICYYNDDPDLSESWIDGWVTLNLPGGKAAEVYPSETGLYEFEVPPGVYQLCSENESCVSLEVSDGLTECHGDFGPAEDWSSCGDRPEWPLYYVAIEGRFAFDPAAEAIVSIWINGIEQRPTVQFKVYEDAYESTGSDDDICTLKLILDSSSVPAQRWRYSTATDSYDHWGFDTAQSSWTTSTDCTGDWVAPFIDELDRQVFGIGFGEPGDWLVSELQSSGLDALYFGGTVSWSRQAQLGDPPYLDHDYVAAFAAERGDGGRADLSFDGDGGLIPVDRATAEGGTLAYYVVVPFYVFEPDFF